MARCSPANSWVPPTRGAVGRPSYPGTTWPSRSSCGLAATCVPGTRKKR
uniref:Uncharacterized protein n=1 Tax=Human herpesvirus 2 TaxID=10310 RepID=A0A481TNZ5_HHV2|nr:hypothetical protein [Human alphaherpesvirus 2]QBH80118.1 hypothetical protein [Human alphaherpesvirus 2]QBH82940.1 hypothetical protein [Human alphaherpesvirus 2]QBH83674.1 hypothetical protein [Human alphaherpesvirus 2]QBH85161.1 hypothetical protein [Human alphaherpesvirus 2]